MDFSRSKRRRKKNESQRLWRRNRTNVNQISSELSPTGRAEPMTEADESRSHAIRLNEFIDDDEHLEIDEIITVNETIQSDETPEIDPTYASDSSSDSSDDDPSGIGIDPDDDTPLYRGSPVSLHKSALSLLRFCRTVNLNKRGVKHLLDALRGLLPMPNKLPRTLAGLLRQCGILPSRRVSYHCSQCMARLISASDPNCSSDCSVHNNPRLPIHVGELYSANVEKQVKIVVENHITLINDYMRNKHMVTCDIPNSRIFQQLPCVAGEKHVTLLLQTDGAPLVKVGTKSLWPIQASIAEIPPPVRDYKSGVIILGAWLGSSHPNRDLLWQKIVQQIKVRSFLSVFKKFHR